MILSLNEIETTVLKAARGAGMEWGLAEEAGQAARWLAVRGVGFEAAFLHIFEAAPWRADFVFAEGRFRPKDEQASLCPIRVGACFSDFGDTLPVMVERVLRPVLLLPFAARLNRPVMLVWDGIDLRLPGLNLARWTGAANDPLAERVEIVESAGSDSTDAAPCVPPARGPEVDMAAWSQIHRFEARTYVPASPRSRLVGAGAGVIDDD